LGFARRERGTPIEASPQLARGNVTVLEQTGKVAERIGYHERPLVSRTPRSRTAT
jgi:hypothetical protein